MPKQTPEEKLTDVTRRIKGAVAALKQAVDVAKEASVWDMRDFCAEALNWLQSGRPFYGAEKGYKPGCYSTSEEMEDRIEKLEKANEELRLLNNSVFNVSRRESLKQKERADEADVRLGEIVELATDGLGTDGAHHKQWYLEEIREQNHRDGNYLGDEGIAP